MPNTIPNTDANTTPTEDAISSLREDTRCLNHTLSIIRHAMNQAWPDIKAALVAREDDKPLPVAVSLKIEYSPGELLEVAAAVTVATRRRFEAEMGLDLVQLGIVFDDPKTK